MTSIQGTDNKNLFFKIFACLSYLFRVVSETAEIILMGFSLEGG